MDQTTLRSPWKIGSSKQLTRKVFPARIHRRGDDFIAQNVFHIKLIKCPIEHKFKYAFNVAIEESAWNLSL